MAAWTCRGLGLGILVFEGDEPCSPGWQAELGHCLAAALPHVLLEPDDSGSSSFQLCIYIYVYAGVFLHGSLGSPVSSSVSSSKGDEVLSQLTSSSACLALPSRTELQEQCPFSTVSLSLSLLSQEETKLEKK